MNTRTPVKKGLQAHSNFKNASYIIDVLSILCKTQIMLRCISGFPKGSKIVLRNSKVLSIKCAFHSASSLY